jgi:RNA polymerase primary sigma factor
MTVKGVMKLQQFILGREVVSLDAPLTTDEGEDYCIGGTISDGTDIQQEVVEDMAAEQLQTELWSTVSNVLKNETMIEILRLRHAEGLTLERTGERLGIHRETVRNLENKALRRLRNNSKTKSLKELVA